MNVALIPVRGGSKSIPLKNIREIAGKPLVYWTASVASACDDIDKVYIATDCKRIKEVVESFNLDKVCVIGRSAETATDTAATESVLLEFAAKYEFDTVVLIQATSPLLTSADLAGGFCEFRRQKTDSVLSVVRQKRFVWETGRDGCVKPANYDVFHRPRRQEFHGFLVENGAFYITSRKALMESGNRLSGNIRAFEMDESTYLEIDEPGDWTIIEQQLMERCRQKSVRNLVVPEIKMFLTDCDGCLTDGGMYYSENGDELKKFNALDGLGLSLLRERGIITGIVTGEKKELNLRRSQKLNLDIFEDGVADKLGVVQRLCQTYKIDLKNVAYVGDDINDLDVIKCVGFGCSVANGIQKVKDAATYVTHKTGGQGAVREVIDLLLCHFDSRESEKMLC